MTTTKLRVLDEGGHHVVVDKEPGMLVVPARGVPAPVLLVEVQRQFGKGVRAVHRLDRGTSGCVVFAKSTFGEQALMDAFRRRRVEKRYLAWVEGKPDFTKTVVDAPLLRDDGPAGKRGPAAVQRVDARGQSALTHVRVLASTGAFSLIEAKPQTGRMHQIRVHCAHLGIPLVGDVLYGATKQAPRVLLHALSLGFPAPSGGRRVCESPLPSDFLSLMDAHEVDFEQVLAPIRATLAAQREKAKTPVKKGSDPAKGRESDRQKPARGRRSPRNADAKAAPRRPARDRKRRPAN